MEERIRSVITKALADAGFGTPVAPIRRPPDPAHGDYAVFVGKPMSDLAVEALTKEFGDTFAKVEVAGAGFVNITLSRGAVSLALAEADAKGEEWGRGEKSEMKAMVEYTDPNPFKEMHIGHLMSNAIGEAIARLTENAGATVTRANYQGDVGPHVARALWGLKNMGVTEPESAAQLGKAYAEGNKADEDSPAAKAEIVEINKAIYRGDDATLMELWRKGREVSLAAFEELYRRLGTHFDYYFFESETSAPGMAVVKDGLARGIFEESEGAVIYRGEEKGLHTLVFITSKGTPTYEAKELGLAFLKEERWPSDRSIVVTANEQIGHFKVVLAALQDIGPLLAAKTAHVAHGFLRLTTGKMSSREGNVITAAEFIKEIVAKAGEKNEDPLIAEQVAIGAIKYMILRQAPGSDIIFDPEKSLSLEGDSGPYLQYALVRARSVLAKAPGAGAPGAPQEPYVIERLLLHYPYVAARAARELSPNLLTTYLTELAGEWNSFYAKEKIVGGEHEAHKLLIARAFVQTMVNGLALLGIPAPVKM